MISRALIALGLLILAYDCADFTVTGVALLAAILIAFGWWMNGAFARDRWIADDATSARLSALDEEIGR